MIGAALLRCVTQPLHAHAQDGGLVRFTPPPEHLVRAEVIEGVRARAAMAADALHLHGAASLRALMHAEYADVVIIEAEALPDLTLGSDLYQQARDVCQ